MDSDELRKLHGDFLALPDYLSEAQTAGEWVSRRDEALRLYSRHAATLAAELLTARAKIAAAENLAEAVKAAIKGEAEAEITDAMADAVDAALAEWEQAQ